MHVKNRKTSDFYLPHAHFWICITVVTHIDNSLTSPTTTQHPAVVHFCSPWLQVGMQGEMESETRLLTRCTREHDGEHVGSHGDSVEDRQSLQSIGNRVFLRGERLSRSETLHPLWTKVTLLYCQVTVNGRTQDTLVYWIGHNDWDYREWKVQRWALF